jgi:nucleotide-binding universal stress UspA family protein
MAIRARTSETMPRIERILVATDFSAQASHALLWAQSLASAFHARLILLHVIDIFSLGEVGCKMGGMDPTQILREQSERCMSELKAEVPEAETMIREGSPRPEVVDAALELKCDVIVMGTHGRSGLQHLLLGSVAEYVVRHSKVPVFTIRTREGKD